MYSRTYISTTSLVEPLENFEHVRVYKSVIDPEDEKSVEITGSYGKHVDISLVSNMCFISLEGKEQYLELISQPFHEKKRMLLVFYPDGATNFIIDENNLVVPLNDQSMKIEHFGDVWQNTIKFILNAEEMEKITPGIKYKLFAIYNNILACITKGNLT